MNAPHASGARRTQGFTLVELMIGMVLGLVVLAAVITVFESNKRTYTATESVGRVQESARVAFELLSRDIRESAGNPCENQLPLYNVLKSSTEWWATFGTNLRGYDGTTALPGLAFGTSPGNRVSGTEAIDLKSSVSDGVNVVSHDPNSAQFKVNTVNHGLSSGDIAMVCDFGQAAIFQVTGASPGINDTIGHNTGEGVPGNCSKGLGHGISVNCSPNGNEYAYGCFAGEWESGKCKDGLTWPATVSKMRMTRWYIGHNARGGRSLFQVSVRNVGGKPETQVDEVAEGVHDMKLGYLRRGGTDYELASSGALNWAAGNVVAVSVGLTLVGQESIGTDGKPLQRSLSHIVTIRNRAQ